MCTTHHDQKALYCLTASSLNANSAAKKYAEIGIAHHRTNVQTTVLVGSIDVGNCPMLRKSAWTKAQLVYGCKPWLRENQRLSDATKLVHAIKNTDMRMRRI